MVFLPDIAPETFLLFAHEPNGASSLRDYSSGRERKLRESVSAAIVLAKTENGRTRFYKDPFRTDGNGVGYWAQVTRQLKSEIVAAQACPYDDATADAKGANA